MKRAFGFSVLACLVVANTACPPPSGLNTRCQLPRRGDGGVSFLTEGQAQESTQANKDFIAFGAVGCEDYVCVRDATFPKGMDLSAAADGYCSTQCIENQPCPSDTSVATLDKNPATAMRCRPILLDAETLAALQQDPVAKKYLGNVLQPYFCARGTGTLAADAGK